ncbi:MAG: hypothetical protein HY255_01260 [Betaproteobacteria bacterium]|nr:hypothetical protein [Betaproteobacteria bacterium]
MPFPGRIHPDSRASLAGAVLGILLIASSVVGLVPVAMNWPASWPVPPVIVLACGTGGVLIAMHMFRHRIE